LNSSNAQYQDCFDFPIEGDNIERDSFSSAYQYTFNDKGKEEEAPDLASDGAAKHEMSELKGKKSSESKGKEEIKQ
jgi:hypothetical protein